MADKKLFGVPFTIHLSNGEMLDGQIILLALTEETAKSQATEWINEKKPWRTENDKRTIERSEFQAGQELSEFYGYGLGDKPLVWEMKGRRLSEG